MVYNPDGPRQILLFIVPDRAGLEYLLHDTADGMDLLGWHIELVPKNNTYLGVLCHGLRGRRSAPGVLNTVIIIFIVANHN